MSFTRRTENFVCEHCGAEVIGTGYTNHCPKCLWSKHVDVDPGDRAATCRGMMEPIGVEIKGGEQIIRQRCLGCCITRNIKSASNDDQDSIIKLSRLSF